MPSLRSFLLSLVGAAALIQTSSAVPTSQRRAACTNPVVRKEWGSATLAERASYISAALCLATKPSRIGLPTTLYDDFAYVHNKLGDEGTGFMIIPRPC